MVNCFFLVFSVQDWDTDSDNGPTGVWEMPDAIKKEWVDNSMDHSGSQGCADQANEWTSPSSQWDSAHPTGWVSASSHHQWTSDESKGLDTYTNQWASDTKQWSSAESMEWDTATNQWALDPNQWSSAESMEWDTATNQWASDHNQWSSAEPMEWDTATNQWASDHNQWSSAEPKELETGTNQWASDHNQWSSAEPKELETGHFQAEPFANDFHSKEPVVKEELEGEDNSSGAMGVAEMTGNAEVTVGQSQTPAGYRWWHGELIPLTPEEQKAVQETLNGAHEKRWKSGWQNRAVMLMALYNKERWLELDRAMKLFSQHHSTYLQTLCLESAIQKWGDAGPKKSGYPWWVTNLNKWENKLTDMDVLCLVRGSHTE